jgi:ABC-2 type transport system ATP-binding protein
MGRIDYIALEVLGLKQQLVKNESPRWEQDPGSGGSQSSVALDCGSFQVRRGEVLGFLGAEGAGKSALVRDVADLLAADDGRIIVSGQRVLRDETAVRRLINRVLADTSLFKRLTPVENLIYGARLYRLGEEKARECALEILEQIGLREDDVLRPVGQLSPSVQQKVADACAALTQPALLLLDEPTKGLSAGSRREMQAFIEELRDVYNATILLTTDDVGEADTICDRVAILDDGRIVALDTPTGLRTLVPRSNGHPPTLEDVLRELTGGQLIQ